MAAYPKHRCRRNTSLACYATSERRRFRLQPKAQMALSAMTQLTEHGQRAHKNQPCPVTSRLRPRESPPRSRTFRSAKISSPKPATPAPHIGLASSGSYSFSSSSPGLFACSAKEIIYLGAYGYSSPPLGTRFCSLIVRLGRRGRCCVNEIWPG
jgi:hypothetical protein